MQQTIISIFRPKLNLATPRNQLSHLVEHFLLSPNRLKLMGINETWSAKNIISDNGFTNELYCVEYYIVPSANVNAVLEKLSKHLDKIILTEEELELNKNILIQELKERSGKMDPAKQELEKILYSKDSPALAHPWHDWREVASFTLKDVEKYFKEYGKPLSIVQLSFDDYNVSGDKLEIIKNEVDFKGTYALQSKNISAETARVEIVIPLGEQGLDLTTYTLYRRSLTDFRLGILQQLRHKHGLIYYISSCHDFSSNSLRIEFNCHEEKIKNCLEIFQQILEDYNSLSPEIIEALKIKLGYEYELDWGDVEKSALFYLEEFALGKDVLPPAKRKKLLEADMVPKLNAINQEVLEKYKNSSAIFISKTKA